MVTPFAADGSEPSRDSVRTESPPVATGECSDGVSKLKRAPITLLLCAACVSVSARRFRAVDPEVAAKVEAELAGSGEAVCAVE